MAVKERLEEVRQVIGLHRVKFAECIAVSTSHLARMALGDKIN